MSVITLSEPENETKIRKLIIIAMLLLSGFTGSAPGADKKTEQSIPQEITIQVEFIETKHSDVTDLLFNKEIKADSGDLRQQIQEKVKAGEASIIETTILRTKESVRAFTTSTDEIKYPESYHETGAAKFETQSTGISLSIDPVFDKENGTILLKMILEFCQRIDDADYGITSRGVRVVQPQFHKVHVETSLTLISGKYAFAGTVRLHQKYDNKAKDPIVMVFVRAMTNLK